MAQQFYTLDEAAKVLGVPPDEVKRMADRNEVRAFRDRGSMRFRGPEIDELARRRGRGSDPDLQLGETRTAPPGPSPAAKSPSPTPKKGGAAPEVFDFSLEGGDSSDQVQIGQELNLSGSGKSKVGKGTGNTPKPSSGKSPPPKPGSDSDVRLVADGSDLDFLVASDSDVKLVDAPAPVPAATPPTKRKTGSPSSGKLMDSGVQMVPLDPGADSDVRLQPDDSNVSLGQQRPKSGSDSDIRLESPKPRPARSPESSAEMLTEEIDLDAELRKAEEADKSRKRPRKKGPKSPPPQPTTSPYELSEADLHEPDAGPAATGFD
jgi:excisionase family DNA binding protein